MSAHNRLATAARALCAIVAAHAFGQTTFFREAELKVVGEIQYGQRIDKIDYTDKPRYRAIHFEGQAGDKVDIRVDSINGQAMVTLTDSRYKKIVSSFGSRITTVLPESAEPNPNRYFILMEEARRNPATFSVSLQKVSSDAAAEKSDYLSCGVNSDCVAVPREGCCHNGYNDAVNKDKVNVYRTANACKLDRPMCPQFLVVDKRVARCNVTSHQCEMVTLENSQ